MDYRVHADAAPTMHEPLNERQNAPDTSYLRRRSPAKNRMTTKDSGHDG